MYAINPDVSKSDARSIVDLLQFAMEVTHISSSIFYWIDETQRMQTVASEGVNPHCLNIYQSVFYKHDPCSPSRMIDSHARTLTLKHAFEYGNDGDFDGYRPYVALSDIDDVLEMLFWYEGRAFAGMGLLARNGQGSISSEAIKLAGSMQRFVESSLAQHPHIMHERIQTKLMNEYRLSKREFHIADLIGQGLKNQEIGEELSIALPTVKSHIQSLFEKLAVSNRTSLIAKMRRLETLS